MTKKDLYHLSVKLSAGVLRDFFDTGPTGFANMEQNNRRKKARKNIYEALAPLLLDTDTHIKG